MHLPRHRTREVVRLVVLRLAFVIIIWQKVAGFISWVDFRRAYRLLTHIQDIFNIFRFMSFISNIHLLTDVHNRLRKLLILLIPGNIQLQLGLLSEVLKPLRLRYRPDSSGCPGFFRIIRFYMVAQFSIPNARLLAFVSLRPVHLHCLIGMPCPRLVWSWPWVVLGVWEIWSYRAHVLVSGFVLISLLAVWQLLNVDVSMHVDLSHLGYRIDIWV